MKGRVQTLYMEYDKDQNSFIWVAQKTPKYEERTAIIDRSISINANTGEIIRREIKRSIAVCVMGFW